MLLEQELLGSPPKSSSQGKTCLPKCCPGTNRTGQALDSLVSPGCWLSDLTVSTSGAESLSIDAKLSIWDSTSAQILLKIRGLSVSLRNRLTTVDLLF